MNLQPDRHQYRLDFGSDAKRVEFQANGIVEAFVIAERLKGSARTVALFEDGLAIGTLSSKGFLAGHCRPVCSE